MDIPAFLMRADRSALKQTNPERRKKAVGRPAKVELWLADEIPQIGSGLRFVIVDRIGTKWVWLKYGYRQNRIRVRKDVFEKVRRKV